MFLGSEPCDSDRVHLVGFGPLQFLFGKAPGSKWIDERNRETLVCEPSEQIPPIVARRFHRHTAVSGITEQFAKPPVPGGFLPEGYGPLKYCPAVVDYSDDVALRPDVNSYKSHQPFTSPL